MEKNLRGMIFIYVALLVLLGSLSSSAPAFDITKNVVSDTGTLTLSGTTGPLYYSNVSEEHAISWTINTTTSNLISYQLLHNGTISESGVLEVGDNSVIHTITPSELALATHNFTLVATDEIETKSWTVLVTIYYSSAFHPVETWILLITAGFSFSVIMYLSYTQRLRVPVFTRK
ncbi:MAG: hypothetical protein ACFFDV_07195 [Candidatus Thorarchaeota archaeon]